MNKEELEKMKEQVLENKGEVPQPAQVENGTNNLEKQKVLVMGPAQRLARVQNILGAKRNGYVDAVILSFITSIGGGIILYLIISAI